MTLQTSPGPEGVEQETSSLLALLAASAIFFCAITGLAVGTLLTDSVPEHYVVVGGPFQTRGDMIDIVSAASGSLTGLGGLDNILTASSPDINFKENLKKAGAWLVLPAPSSLGCGDMEGLGTGA